MGAVPVPFTVAVPFTGAVFSVHCRPLSSEGRYGSLAASSAGVCHAVGAPSSSIVTATLPAGLISGATHCQVKTAS